LLVLMTVLLISWWTFTIAQVNGLNGLKITSFVLFNILLLPIVLSFWTAAIGFIVQLKGGDPLEVTRSLQNGGGNTLIPFTAVVMPVFNEDPVRVFAGIKATYEDLERTGRLSSFDLFILSDTTDPDIWVQEEMAFAALQKEVRHPQRLIYRNRRENRDRKIGNIAEFCATWGDRYVYMILFDADSVMSGESLIKLVRLMEQNPNVGIVQAPPFPVNRMTLFGRLYQFAVHAYSMTFISGLNFWQGGAANYWGHNAIIRIRPFVEHCRLPTLPGEQPLGGCILSHDFVEAAFMRRAGWKVYLATELRGSYEELPSSLIGYAARDRRWCQGNLQHSRLLFTPGFHAVNRVHLLMGIMSYVSSPLWLLLLILTTIEGVREHLGAHTYFAARSLFPSWQISIERQAGLLFSTMLGLLMLPRFFCLLVHFRARERLANFGGRTRLCLSVVAETLSSVLLAPNLALLQTRFVISILLGRNTTWGSQDRGDAETGWREAFRRHWRATLLGIVWSSLLLWAFPRLFWWFSPVLIGLLLAVPLSAWSSRSRLGQRFRKAGLFVIPEEVNPPLILQRLHESLQAAGASEWASRQDGLLKVTSDAEIARLHLSFLSAAGEAHNPIEQNYLEGLKLKVFHEGTNALSPGEKRRLLLDPAFVRGFLNSKEGTSRRVPEMISP
jgi:membrane glycosyltransferase